MVYISHLESIRDLEICRNIELSSFSSWKVGGIVSCLVFPKHIDSLVELVLELERLQVSYQIVGHTTNLLIEDGLFKCVLISTSKLVNPISTTPFSDAKFYPSGVWVPNIARDMMLKGVAGYEHIVGIPGSLGGLILMNGGSLRKSISEKIISVTVLHNSKIKVMNLDECKFSYRHSIFSEQKDFVILGALLDTSENKSPKVIRNEMLKILRDRRVKFPRKLPNCGSTFVSDSSIYKDLGPPGQIIENCGLKGFTIGDAKISELHANFIVNIGKAKSSDIYDLIYHVKNVVMEQLGINLKTEVKYLRLTGNVEDL